MPTLTATPAVSIPSGPFRQSPPALRNLPPIRKIPGKVRLVKDLLRVGRWPVGMDGRGNVQFWDVKPDTLADIARVFTRQKNEGQTRPLQWGHVDTRSGAANADPTQVVDYWDALFVEGSTLWGVIYVTQADAEDLLSVNRPVSVGVDYQGNVMTPGTVTPVKNALLHVAIVDQGAMPGQGPFIQMGQQPKRNEAEYQRWLKIYTDTNFPPKLAAKLADIASRDETATPRRSGQVL